ncbi:dTMP kinase [Actinoplanes teichomyceticus]|uniref:dTMP kinase n=1 Tax=Actinoplanes teichomyceticus TaxID=1867 RepID=UPI001A3EFF44|nr:dTMP kinase [Actinoplanes teichomyceticus]GIF15125.1 dTMP kinase [Actinoplanes teichomyceticus]
MLGLASFGDWIGLLATGLFASAQFDNSAAQGAAFGGTIAVRLLPALLLGPIAGVFADRFDRRYTMVITDLIRFVFYGSIPLVPLFGGSAGLTVTWATIATFVGETITLIWIPAKEAAVPNLIPKSRIEISNQLTLVTTYGITPILAALGLSALTAGVQHSGVTLPDWAQPVQLALYLNALSRLATALVVFFGIREIGGKSAAREQAAEQSMTRQFLDGWKYIGRTPLVRGLVLGIFGAFAAGGVVIGAARTYATSLGAGEAAFSLLFGVIFLGLAVGIGLGPMIVKELSRRRWFGMSIVLSSGSVMFLGLAFHLSMALLGALLVGAGAGMAFLAGLTLLYGEVEDAVRGRVFAVVQIGVRMVLLLAITLAGLLVGLGSSRQLDLGAVSVDVSSTRVLLLVAGAIGIWVGVGAFRQMDDKKGVPVLGDLFGSVRGRPLAPPEEFVRTGVFVVFEGGEGAGKSTQVNRLADALRAEGRDVVVTREPGATDIGSRIRALVLDKEHGAGPSPRAEALLYAADRAHHVATVVRPALARGAVVISDRYVDSSLAYQGAGRTLPVQEISWLSSWATGGLKPDLVVLLDVDPGVGLSRVSARGAGADRLESESRGFHERVRYAFLDLAAADPKRYLVLDAARPAEQIAAAVSERLTPLLVAATPAESAATPAESAATPAESAATPAESAATPPQSAATPAQSAATSGRSGAASAESAATPVDPAGEGPVAPSGAEKPPVDGRP